MFIICFHFNKGNVFKENNLPSKEQVLSFEKRNQMEGINPSEKQTDGHKSYSPLVKMVNDYGVIMLVLLYYESSG